MGLINVVYPSESDWKKIGLNLRDADKREIEGLVDVPPPLVVRYSIQGAHWCRVVLLDQEPIMTFGVTRDSGSEDYGVVWLMSTPEIQSIKMRFLRESRHYLNEMFASGPFVRLHNIADTRNSLHMKWLRWLGATFDGERIRTHYERFQIRR